VADKLRSYGHPRAGGCVSHNSMITL
jgi:hypothetical protein